MTRSRSTALVLITALVVAACGPQSSPAQSNRIAATPVGSEPTSAADVIFRDANVITMDDGMPTAEAVAIAGDQIIGVGTNADVDAFRGPSTISVSLRGLTLTPGFIDGHQHRIGDGPTALSLQANDIIDAAIAQGWTTIDELYVDEGRLSQLRDLDASGVLRLRVNAYLPVMENSVQGTLLGDYYTAFQPGQVISPHVRVAGLKIFTDFDNARYLLWQQGDLNDFVLARHREGWPLAIKTVATESLAMILKALQATRAADSTVADARVRLEHMLFATPTQITEIKDLGAVPMINLNNPGQLVSMADIDAFIAREPKGSYTPWRSVFDAGIPAGGISGFPSLYVDEPKGAPFGSPMHLIYQGVTRVGNLGVRSPTPLLDQAITAAEGMRALTVNAARATFQEDALGSIAVGRLADLVVLSGDPTTGAAAVINDIRVLMTMIGGEVEFCADRAGSICPHPGGGVAGETPSPASSAPVATPAAGGGADLAFGASVRASSELAQYPAANVVDGTAAHWNAADAAPGWIELTLPAPATVARFDLTVAQDPGGKSVHELWIRRTGGSLERIRVFRGITSEGQVLSYVPPEPINDVTLVKVVTVSIAGGLAPAWREIALVGP